jgi:8-oxo-dGTP pyrophosphatase MutT (NUDIX family)
MSSEPPRGRRARKGGRGRRSEHNPKRGGKESPKAGGKESPKAGAKAKATAKPQRPRASRKREFSAGGVVVRDRREVVVIVPTRRAADGSRVLALPKGHVDPGETPLQAAEREVREETGIVGRPLTELGETRYWYRRDGRTIGKSVAFFLFEHVDGDIADHDDEVEEVRWVTLEDALRLLSHAAEREMVELAAAYLHQDR